MGLMQDGIFSNLLLSKVIRREKTQAYIEAFKSLTIAEKGQEELKRDSDDLEENLQSAGKEG